MSVEAIKQFCKLLSAYNVIRVEATYDGSGDSGDLDVINVVTHPTPAQIDNSLQMTSNAAAITTAEKRIGWRVWMSDTVNKPDALITKNMCDEFLDELFDLLPGGWEINDGSYGEIIVDVAEETVSVEHNERYTEVRSETFWYE